MIRRTLARALVVLVAGTAAVVFSAGTAQAFRIGDPHCDPYNRIRIDVRADSGIILATVIWDDTKSYAELTIADPPNDESEASVRVDNGSTVIQYEDNFGFAHKIYYSVRKFRLVWFGVGRDWVSPHLCSP